MSHPEVVSSHADATAAAPARPSHEMDVATPAPLLPDRFPVARHLDPAAPLAFFGDIARLSRDEYVRRMCGLSPDAALEQILIYNHTSSLILVTKFRQLGLCFRFFRVCAGCWVVLVVVVAWRVLHG